MKKTFVFVLLTIIAATGCKRYNKYEGVAFTEKEPRDWENPGMLKQNREDPHQLSSAIMMKNQRWLRINQPHQTTFRLTAFGNFTLQNRRTRDLTGSLKMIMIPATGTILRFLQTGR